MAKVAEWRERAAFCRDHGDERGATFFTKHADELERLGAEADDELLTLQAAAEESGYSADHLGRLVRDGKLANHGRSHVPRVRRGELPRKPAALHSERSEDKVAAADKAKIVRARNQDSSRLRWLSPRTTRCHT